MYIIPQFMTKGERRKARKQARAEGGPLTDELAILKPEQREGSLLARYHAAGQEFTETPRGDRARERWARRYDELNGAPEGDGDR